MTDFQAALRQRLERSEQLRREREDAEVELARLDEQRREEASRRLEAEREARLARHGELVTALTAAAEALKASAPQEFVVRLGWTTSGEEFIAKISTRLTEPARSLLIELDRDDDEVLVRWRSDVGNALELWRILEVEPPLLEELILQIADDDLWRAGRTPRFPGAQA